ncbi:hypothetical protein CP532_2457 [Ophiocordyceps camponoti-leonardi (nom. inval.)]|nr:hypothetical protein CP532_2457 [Ophiocordyceps camponoti-leonardi (nom. inval.)]
MASPGFVLEQYRLLQEQHEELCNHLQQMCPSRQPSASSVSTRSSSPSSSSTHHTPPPPPPPPSRSPSRITSRRRRARCSGWPTTADALDTIVDEDTLCDITAEERRLSDVNEGIKRALTELLNTDTVRGDSSMRMWAQARLMETEKELRSGRRRRTPHKPLQHTSTQPQPCLLPRLNFIKRQLRASARPASPRRDLMSVLLETSVGDIVIDLLVDHTPQLFLKLCKIKYYNFSPVHSVQKDFSFQTGDPLGPLSSQSDGGSSIWGHVSGDPSLRTFAAFFHPKLKHLERGTVSMATAPLASDPDTRVAAAQFIITLGEETDYLDGKAAVFGKVVEGFDTLEKINGAIVDEKGYPLIDIRIKHTVVLDDPYPDPVGLRAPDSSPPPTDAQLETVRIADENALHENDGLDEEQLERRRREREAKAQALTLEMMGDLPFAEVKPPENVLFVCKLNPVTTDDDLELIFGRFGKILSCEVIRDQKTGDSLQYAFIEYQDKSSCEAAYFKMQGVLIDDRRIHVDFSQSVSRLSDVWRKDTNDKRRANASRGGWGGVRELEKRRQYRAEVERPTEDGYGMVYGEEEMRGRHERDGRDRLIDDRPRHADDRPQRDDRRRETDDRPPRGADRSSGYRNRRAASRSRSRSRSPPRRNRSGDRHARGRDDDRRGDRGNRDRRDGDRGRRDWERQDRDGARRREDSYRSRR